MKAFRSFLPRASLPIVMASALFGQASLAQTLVTTEQNAGVSVSNLQVNGSEVQGEIVNRTGATLIEAEVVIRHRWLWANEMRPGADDPGWVDAYPLQVTAAPGAITPFRVQASRVAPQREDGTLQAEAFVRQFKTIPSQ